ncbi:MAG: serine/threonine protein kinase [Armatimonadetes bacterium]|nr:serine/threonine protein kinase [Armatimonadota bacterium]
MQSRMGETFGGYVLIREIGHGGMSVVHQAVDRRTGKTVALKVYAVPPSLSPEERKTMLMRFAREARAMARLSHPGIVAIHEVGEQDGMHFLATEYLEGQTLQERLARGPLTPSEAAPILSQVAEAIDAVHAAGVVHRDIKPSNVMLLPDGTAKLLDFGVARQSEDTAITSLGAIIGSPTYIAPEQVQGDHGNPASDIWSLGVLLYEMLSGRPPFEGTSVPSVLFKVVHEAPAPVASVGVPVQRVLHRVLEKEPRRRYPTARALADALQDAVRTPSSPALAQAARRWGPPAALLVLLAVLGLALLNGHGRPQRASRNVIASHPATHRTAAPAIQTAAAPPPVPSVQRTRRLPGGAKSPGKRPPHPAPKAAVARRSAPAHAAPVHVAAAKVNRATLRPLHRAAGWRQVAQTPPHTTPARQRRGDAPERHSPRRAYPRHERTRSAARRRRHHPRWNQNWESHRLQILEKFIWAEGR